MHGLESGQACLVKFIFQVCFMPQFQTTYHFTPHYP